jgi:O-antigen/teichoic acid export membrane protein
MISKLKTFLFKNLSTRQTLTKNVFWLTLGQIGSRLLRAIIIIYAARALGAGEYGVFSYILGLAGFFTVFSDMGVNTLLMRDAASYPEERSKYFAASFWLKIALLFVASLLLIFVAPHFSKIGIAISLFSLVALMSVFDGLGEFFNSFLRGVEKMELDAFIMIAKNIVLIIVGFSLLTLSPNAQSLIISYSVSLGLGAILAAFFVRKQFLTIFRYFDLNLIKKIVSSAWPIAFSSVLGMFMINTDVVMLGWLRTAQEIGYYSIGQRFVPVLLTLPNIFATAMFPILSRFAGQKEQQKEKNLNEKSMALIFMIVLPIILGGIILATPIIKLIFGQSYLPAVSAFRILITSLIWIFPNVFLTNIVLVHNYQKKIVKYLILSSVVNIGLNILLIPWWGIIGAAVATLVSQTLYVAPTWLTMKKINNFYTLRYLKKIIAGAIIMAGVSFILNYFNLNVILNIVISTGVYFGILYLLKEKVLGEILILFKKFKEVTSQ